MSRSSRPSPVQPPADLPGVILFSEEHRIVADGPASEILAKRSLLLDVELIDERRVIHVPEIHHGWLSRLA